MKYINHKNNALELVIELLLSLESSKLINDFIQKVEVFDISEDENKSSTENYLVLNSRHLNELATTDYISDEDFNMLVINRFIEDLKHYMYIVEKSNQDYIRLRLVDYADITRETLRKKSLRELFILEKLSWRYEEFHSLKKRLLMEEQLTDEPQLFSRKEALNRLCGSLNEDKDGINSNNRDLDDAENQLKKINDFIEGDSPLKFIKVPHMFVTDSKSKTYQSLNSSHKFYKKYISPLVRHSNEKEYKYYYTSQKTQQNIDAFNDLSIFGTFKKLDEYLLILPDYEKADDKPKNTFKKALKRDNRRTLNPMTTETLSKAANGEKKYNVKPVDGLLVHCFWAIHNESDIFKSFTRMERHNNVTDYLDTLIRYYIFINEEILQNVLPKFAQKNEDYYKSLIKKRETALTLADTTEPIREDERTRRFKKYTEFHKEAKKFNSSFNEVKELGEKIIKDHFHYDILKEIISLYVNAIEQHQIILKDTGLE